MHPDLPPGNLTNIHNAIQSDLIAVSPEARQAYFRKLKVGAMLTVRGISQDVIADWDGRGDFRPTGVPDSTVQAFEEILRSDYVKHDNSLERFFMAGIEIEEPDSDETAESSTD